MKKRYLRVKGDVKRRLGMSSGNSSSTSLPDPAPSAESTGPLPPVAGSGGAPLSNVPLSDTNSSHPATTTFLPAQLGLASPPISGPVNVAQHIPPEAHHPEPLPADRIPENLLPTNPTSGSKEKPKTLNWPGLELLLKTLNSTTGVFAPLKAAISGFSDLVEVFEVASKDRSDYTELQKRLDTLLGDVSQHLSSTMSPRMTMSMKNLCMGIHAELQIVGQKLKRDALRRHIESVDDPGQVLECYRRIQEHLERLALNANLSVWETVEEIARETRLQRLSPANSAVYNSAKSEDIQRRACTLGTRQDELTRLLKWARMKDGEEVCWMDGMAGTGKTTIAYSLCAELEATAELGASFFCSRLIPECRDVKLIIPTLAYQLARFSSPFCSVLLNTLKTDPDVHTRALKIQLEHLLIGPLIEVRRALPTGLVVVIDALDECENEDSVDQLLDLLFSKTPTSSLPIRLLISSRPEPLIYSRMMDKIGANNQARLVLHEIDEKKVNLDIEIYLTAELEQAHLAPSQLAALVIHCGVLFIYASTAARYIKDGLRFRQHMRRLNMILGLVPPSEDGKDRDIDRLYTSILKSAFESQHLDQSDRTLMKTLLDVIIYTQEPITVVALSGLLGVDDVQQVDGLLRPLSSVLNISELSGLVNTLHASFPDFLRNRARSAAFHCDPQTTHSRIARSCLQLIGANDSQFNICALASSHLRDKEVLDLIKRVDQAVSVPLFYSCRYWATHLELGEGDNSARESIYDFLSNRLLFWMEVLNLEERMYLGPRIMQHAERWTRANECSEEVIHLVHDAWRFVTMFASHAVSQSTPHIYLSMLTFWPESAPIAKCYRKRMQRPIQVNGSAMTRRQLALLATWVFPDEIRAICYSPDGALIACAIAASVHLVDGNTGQVILGPLEHNGRVKEVAFAPDGRLLVSCSNDTTVKVWDTHNGQLVLGPFTGHTDWVNSVSFTPNGKCVVSGSQDGTIRVWNLESGCTIVGPLQGGNSGIGCICVSSDGSRVASGSYDGRVHVWNTENGQTLLGPLEGHAGIIRSICFSPDGTRLATGSDDNQIRIWSKLTDQIHVEVLEGHTRPVNSIAISPDGKHVVSGSLDYTVRQWNIEDRPALVGILKGHTNAVFCVRFSPDGARIVSSSFDRTVLVWDAWSQGTVEGALEGHANAVTSVALLHDDTQILSGSTDRAVCLWDAHTGKVVVGPMKGHSEWVNSVCFSPNGSRVASGSRDQTVQIWDAYTGQAVGEPLTGHSGMVFTVCFSPDGALLASGSQDQAVRLWSTQSGEPIGTPFEAHTSWVVSICFSPDGSRLISGSCDKTNLIWGVGTGKPLLPPLTGHTDMIWTVCISPDGKCIASGSDDTTVQLWDAHSGQRILDPLLGHLATVRSVCFSPDSSYLVSCSDDRTIRLWDAQSGQLVGSPLNGHADCIRSLAFSSTGRWIVSGADDMAIRLWDVADLVQRQMPEGNTSEPRRPPSIIRSWTLQDDGWVVDSQSQLLAWVPPDLHTSLMSPRNMRIISTKGAVQLDLESASLGESWAECYKP